MYNRKPVIGITAVASFDERMHSQRVTYAQAVWESGGEAVLLPCNPDKSNCKQIVNMLDGLLVPGGHDVDPQLYGEDVHEKCGKFIRYEDEYDMELVKEAMAQKKPILGICRGMQVINVLYGGTLYQDIPTQYSEELIHTRIDPINENLHPVYVESESHLAKMLGKSDTIIVNSSHHQAVKDVANGFKVTAKSSDGIIEAMENEDASIVCVQWHPERLQHINEEFNFIKKFVEKCN